MVGEINLNLREKDLLDGSKEVPSQEKMANMPEKEKFMKKSLAMLICGILGGAIGVCCLIFALLMPPEVAEVLVFPDLSTVNTESPVYSALTGEILANASQKTAPAYCIQTPNGTDGARPQSGLNEAGVIFEAIAEAGITRFAAIYQNPSAAVIGPIRSLRVYYLDWDVPFDCTIVHAGGAANALEALAAGGYRDLTENYQYMYRGTVGTRLWNNLFTTANYLKQFSADRGYTTSEIKGFARMTPEASQRDRIDRLVEERLEITTPASGNTSAVSAQTTAINLRFGGWPAFNVHYEYNSDTNSYLRSYENGASHEIYACSSDDLGESNPETVCTLTQLAPKVVIAMVVQEGKADDNYHEDITTIGSGEVYVFQNGTVISGTWNKPSREEQIKFLDQNGTEILLAPGQTMVSAVPTYGSIEF